MARQGIEPGPLTLESDALPIASGGPAQQIGTAFLNEGIFFAHVKFSIVGISTLLQALCLGGGRGRGGR